MADDYLTAAQAAEEIGISREMMARYCRAGTIPAIRVGPNWAIKRKDLRKFERPPTGRPPNRKD